MMEVTFNGFAKAIRISRRSLGQDSRLWVAVIVLLAHALAGYAVFLLPLHAAVQAPRNIIILTLPVAPRLPEPVVTMPPIIAPIGVPLRAPPRELNLPGTESTAAAIAAMVAVPSEHEKAVAMAPPIDSREPSQDWQAQLAAWIQAHKAYPPLAQQRGQQGVVTVEFEVLRNGQVSSVRLLRSSGVAILDAAALALLANASVPPFTSDMQKQSVFVTMALDYNLQGYARTHDRPINVRKQ